MKSSIIAFTAVALAATTVSADDSNCWMSLGQYSVGGVYCVAPLPAFSEHDGCENAVSTCKAEYAQCKTTTQSPSACLQLFTQCNTLSTFCDTFCVADADGNTSDNCSLDQGINWDGITMPTVTEAPAVITPVVVIKPTTSAAAVYYTPPTYNKPASPSAAAIKSTPVAYVAPAASTPAVLITPDLPCGYCATDGSNGKRGLSVQKYAPYGTSMTPGVCLSLCSGYKYSAVEFSSECWCGNSFFNNPQPSDQCTMPCTGDKSTMCGGSWLFNIYQQGCTYTAPVKSTPAAYVPAPVKSTPVAYVPAPAKTTAAYVAPAPAAATVAKVTPTIGICSIPSAYATPIGGYHAPIVACNDLSDYKTSPWKLYNTHATSNAPVYAQANVAKACQDSCSFQYNSCTKDYASSLNTYSSYSSYKMRRGASNTHAKRTWWLYGAPAAASNSYAAVKDTYSTAMTKCTSQRSACIAANTNTAAKGTCGANGVYTASTGSTSYNAASNSYGSYNTGNTYAGSSYSGSAIDNNDYYKK